MNAATEFDLGPLTWVKGEIDAALDRAGESLDQFRESKDATKLKFCKTHIHQVRGALDMVGLDGVTQVTETLEGLLSSLEEQGAASDEALSVIERVISAIRQYLDDLMAGVPNQPLRLLPVYRAMNEIKGGARFRPSDLFFPDLSIRPPKRTEPMVRLTPDEFKACLKRERMRFQKGLLALLRSPGTQAAQDGLAQMQEALRAIEATQETPAARNFWWVSQGLLDALSDQGVAAEQEVKQLCARIDLQIRRLLEGSRNVAERLLRDALFYIGQSSASAGKGIAATVRSSFQLEALIPKGEAIQTTQPQEVALRRLREVILATEEFWNKFCAGSAAALTGFADQAKNCEQVTLAVGHTDLKRLAQGLAAIAVWLAEQPARQSDSVAMEVATAILLLQNAQENFKRLGTDFAAQVDLMVARLHACISGTPLSAEEDVPLLDEVTRRAQEKLLITQVAREIQSNLAQIEEALDIFFRDPEQGFNAAAMAAPIKQISGALTILGHDKALISLQECEIEIKRFGEAGYRPSEQDFETVAQKLSTLGFFIDSLQTGTTDFEQFMRKLRGEDEQPEEEEEDVELQVATAGRAGAEETPVEHIEAEPLAQTVEMEPASVEEELEQKKEETKALLAALKEAPEDEGLKNELKQNLQSLQADADLLADHELSENAKAALSALESGTAVAHEVDAAMAATLKTSEEAPAPTAETLKLAQASHEEIDAELLEIFLEEAREVIGNLATELESLRAQPHNIDTLTNIRRATHTLKGSGRMVGLKDLGEVAWECEQTLNMWLRQEIDVTPELLDMIGMARDVFSVWVQELTENTGNAPDARPLVALAGRLRGVEQAASAPAVVAPAPAAVQETPKAEGQPEECLSEGEEIQPEPQALQSERAECTDTGEGIVAFDAFELPEVMPAADDYESVEVPSAAGPATTESTFDQEIVPAEETQEALVEPMAEIAQEPLVVAEELPVEPQISEAATEAEAIGEVEFGFDTLEPVVTEPAGAPESIEIEAQAEVTLDQGVLAVVAEASVEPEKEEPGAEAAMGTETIEFNLGDLSEPFVEPESVELPVATAEEPAPVASIELPAPVEALATEAAKGEPAEPEQDFSFSFSLGEAPEEAVATELAEAVEPPVETPASTQPLVEEAAEAAVQEPATEEIVLPAVLSEATPVEGTLQSDGIPITEQGILAEENLPAVEETLDMGCTVSVEPEKTFERAGEDEELERQLLEEARASEALQQEGGQEELPGSEAADNLIPQTLYDIFCEEARQHLDTLRSCLAEIEADPKAPTTFAMTRAAHTLGGIAATVGLMPINKLAIALEHALLRRDNSPHPDSIEGLEIVRQTILALEDMFVGLSSQIPPESQPVLLDSLENIFDLQVAPAVVEELGAASEPVAFIEEVKTEHVTEEKPAAALDAEIGAVAGVASLLQEAPKLKDELDDQLLPIFLEEAQDLVQGFAEQLHAWRENVGDAEAPRALARLLHTFKGGARMAGAMNLGEMTHSLETGLEDALRSGQLSMPLLEQIESGCDALTLIVDRLMAGESPTLPVMPAAVAQSETPAVQKEMAAASATETKIETPQAVETVVPAAAPAAAAQAEHETADRRALIRVRADLVDRLVNEAGELSIARARIEGEMLSLKSSLLDLTENIIRLRRQLREIEIQSETQMQARTQQSHEGKDEFDPLELDRFTRFQELTRFMAESVNDVATVQQSLLKNLDDTNAAIVSQARMTRSLQQNLMSIRMVPFNSQSERLYRIVRQTGKELGKRANLDIKGGHVELDRSVLDKIMAPIEHMLRNAISHGIEDREQRKAANKPDVGDITLTLSQEGNEIVLAMADDGAGLNAEKIRARAESRGLLAPGEEISEAGLYDFIFQPGFSTASEVTQIAGRGVGMDVVKSEVLSLGGRIEILSSPGKGTTFRLYLPLTLTVMQTLLVRAGGVLYAVPSTMIEQVLEVKEEKLLEIRNQGAAEWKGNIYPYSFLPHLLGTPDVLPETRRRYWVLLLRSGAKRVAVLVDELQGNHEVVIKNIGAQLARVVGLAGATVLGDGRVVLILNPVALAGRQPVISVARVAEGAGAEAAPPVVVEEAATMPTVLVVDDSLTVRKITGRLLAREGYQVITAKDGVDALEHLVETIPDVMLSDVEMPRMDGFDLVRNVRADPRLVDLPIIMITSRTADKHRNYALEIGASEYLGKPYEEEKLLELIAGFVKKKRAS